MPRRPPRLATRLLSAQVLVIAVGALTLLLAVAVIGPPLFHAHLSFAGGDSPEVQDHAEQAFASALAIAVTAATVVALAVAVLLAWIVVRRVSRPVEQLARAASSVATGSDVQELPEAAFAAELDDLATAFADMTGRLADTDAGRTRLLADLAHEIRTPLATLEAYIDGLEDGVVAPTDASYSTMRDQVHRLRRLAEDLRESAAADEHALGIVLEPVDAAVVAVGAVTAVAPRYAAKGVTLEHSGPRTGLAVRADPVRLGQVLANLLDNALRHTPAGGTVTVTAVLDEDGRHVRVDVADDGEGIRADELDRVFDRFHRGDPARGSTDGSGSGLGLTIARAIVADHGGTLSVASDGPGAGSVFTVRLPVLR